MAQKKSGSGIKLAAVVLVLAAVATVGLIALGIRQSVSEECEVCITFQGRTACRRASGVTTDEATQTAIQNACATISAGMTQTIQCQNRAPDSVTCQ